MHFQARAYAQTVASACASSTEALVHAYAHLQEGIADVVIAGGSESAIHPMTLAAFSSMQALSRRNDDPAGASRPYDITRDGFVMGEGAAALVLETEEHALEPDPMHDFEGLGYRRSLGTILNRLTAGASAA